jgi:tetratricopeptide (TPR) repeat protein
VSEALEGQTREELEQRLAHALAVGDEPAMAAADTALSACLLAAGDAPGALRHAERAVAARRSHGSGTHDLARALEALGHAAQALGDGPAATGAYLEAMDLATRRRHRAMVASLLSNLGTLAAAGGDRDRARDLLGAALKSAPQPRAEAARRAELGLARLELEDGDDVSAARRALRVLQGGAEGHLAMLSARLLVDAGRSARNRGDDQLARHRYEFALPVLRSDATPAPLVDLLAMLGGVCRAGGDRVAARAYWDEGVGACADEQSLLEARCRLLRDLGTLCLHDLSDPGSAVLYLEAALATAEEVGLLDLVAELGGLLHETAGRLGDTAGAARWRALQTRTAFATAVAGVAAELVAGVSRVSDLPTYVLGDTGGRPETVRIPGGRLGDGLIWRRRLAAEVRRAAPRGRLAVLRAASPEMLHLVVLDRDGTLARGAVISPGVRPDRWLRVSAPPSGDRLIEALWRALKIGPS